MNKKLEKRAAVYEFALVHPARPNTRVKVYVGKAVDLKQRHNQYLQVNGEDAQRMANRLSLAVEQGCQVWRRFRYVEGNVGNTKDSVGDRYAAMMETRMLSYFDYALNQTANPPKRTIWLEPRTVFCCFPAGVIVHNVEPMQLGTKGPYLPARHKAGSSCF